MLRILRETGGGAFAVSEGAIRDAQRLLARLEGIWTSPEGAVLIAALGQLKDAGQVTADARVVIMLTGSGIKYTPPELPTPLDLTGNDEAIRDLVRRVIGA
jgi:threonine synthase